MLIGVAVGWFMTPSHETLKKQSSLSGQIIPRLLFNPLPGIIAERSLSLDRQSVPGNPTFGHPEHRNALCGYGTVKCGAQRRCSAMNF